MFNLFPIKIKSVIFFSFLNSTAGTWFDFYCDAQKSCVTARQMFYFILFIKWLLETIKTIEQTYLITEKKDLLTRTFHVKKPPVVTLNLKQMLGVIHVTRTAVKAVWISMK